MTREEFTALQVGDAVYTCQPLMGRYLHEEPGELTHVKLHKKHNDVRPLGEFYRFDSDTGELYQDKTYAFFLRPEEAHLTKLPAQLQLNEETESYVQQCIEGIMCYGTAEQRELARMMSK